MHKFDWFTRDEVAVVQPPDEVDLSNADDLRRCCQTAIDATGPRLVVDLGGTTFLDSSALSVFVGLARQLEADGGWLRLASGNSSGVRKFLEITQLDTVLGNYPSVDGAMGE